MLTSNNQTHQQHKSVILCDLHALPSADTCQLPSHFLTGRKATSSVVFDTCPSLIGPCVAETQEWLASIIIAGQILYELTEIYIFI